jgi:hypothetical protein
MYRSSIEPEAIGLRTRIEILRRDAVRLATIFRRTTMTKSKIAVLATLATLVAAPAFAGDQNTATELQDSGRYVPQARVNAPVGISGAYASVRQAPRTQFGGAVDQQDFQLVGHN